MATTKQKPVAKKAPSRKSLKKSIATPAMKSFVLAKDTPPFFILRFTHQTVYWFVLSALILTLGIWVIALNVQVQGLYDQIEANGTANDSVIVEKTN
jgi:hypothetical protein